MESPPSLESGTTVPPIHGTKRRATCLEPKAVKKARVYQNEHDSQPNVFDHECSEESEYTDSEDAAGSSAVTPLTPISSKSSSRYPSDLNKNYQCPYDGCQKSFNRPAKLTQHIRSHTNTRPFICPHAPCTKDFLRESHLKHHIKSAHSGVRDHVCEWEGCGKTFITATRLKRHHAAHEGREKFRCTVAGCEQTFRKHGTLQKHILAVHEGQDPFVCAELLDDGQKCNAGFDTEGKLKSHMGRTHRTKTFLCAMCSFGNDDYNAGMAQERQAVVFSSHAALQAHMTSEHPPTCTECGLQCTSQSALRNHTEVIHGDLGIDERRTYICPEPDCGRGFTKKGNLNAHHQISHTGKRFICGVVDPKTLSNVEGWDGSDGCGEPSTSKRNLERHIRAVHLGLETLRKAKRKGDHSIAEGSSRKSEVSVMMRLTGSGYETESGRHLPCLVHGCDYRFMRDYDLEIHLQSRHSLADVEIQGMLAERDSCSQPTLGGPQQFAQQQVFRAPSSTSMHCLGNLEMGEQSESLEALAHTNGGLWHGGQLDGMGYRGDGWMLNGEGTQRMVMASEGDVEMIDPSLI